MFTKIEWRQSFRWLKPDGERYRFGCSDTGQRLAAVWVFVVASKVRWGQASNVLSAVRIVFKSRPSDCKWLSNHLQFRGVEFWKQLTSIGHQQRNRSGRLAKKIPIVSNPVFSRIVDNRSVCFLHFQPSHPETHLRDFREQLVTQILDAGRSVKHIQL